MNKNKRNFLKLASFATLSSGLSPSVLGLSKAADLNIGIIGTGVRGTGLLKIINETPGVRVGALCDTLAYHGQKAQKLVESSTPYYDNHHALLENKKIDAVIVATPFSSHGVIANDALEAKKHVYCEKTMVYGIKEAIELAQKASKSGVIFQTGHQYRSSSAYIHAIDLVKSGYLGTVTHIENQWNRNSSWRRDVPSKELERQINWRMYREYSGGLTAELCSHHMDFANWLAGDHPYQVMATGGVDYYKDGRETFDNVQILTRYKNGISSTYKCVLSNAKDGEQIKIMGTKGTIVLKHGRTWVYAEKKADEIKLGEVDGVSGATLQAWKESEGVQLKKPELNPTKSAVVEFRDSIINGTIPRSNEKTGAIVSVTVQMAINSMLNNSVETWKKSYDLV